LGPVMPALALYGCVESPLGGCARITSGDVLM
jgi:hypothetical protein